MPAPERNRWTEWLEITRERKDVARLALREWWVAVKAEPELFWQTPAVRYAAYGLGALMVIFAMRTAIEMLQPVDPKLMTPRAKTANFDVICSNPQCRQHFLIERKFKFRRFPVTCRYCDQETGRQALRCTSEACRGKLVMTARVDSKHQCTACGATIGSGP